MTSAKILGKLAEGHGMTDAIVDGHYAARQKGEPPGEIVAIVVLKPVGSTEGDTAKGRHHSVTYEISRCEPVTDPNHATDLRFSMHSYYESRHAPGGRQRPLPLGMPGMAREEQRKALEERIKDWADDHDPPLTDGDIQARWCDYWVIGPNDDASWGDRGVPKNWHEAAILHLMEFGSEVGAIADPEAKPEPAQAELPDADGGTDETGDASDEGAEPDTAAQETGEAAPPGDDIDALAPQFTG